jgi:hypothetical protein
LKAELKATMTKVNMKVPQTVVNIIRNLPKCETGTISPNPTVPMVMTTAQIEE